MKNNQKLENIINKIKIKIFRKCIFNFNVILLKFIICNSNILLYINIYI